MKVRELIEKLQQFGDPNLDVWQYDSRDGEWVEVVEPELVNIRVCGDFAVGDPLGELVVGL